MADSSVGTQKVGIVKRVVQEFDIRLMIQVVGLASTALISAGSAALSAMTIWGATQQRLAIIEERQASRYQELKLTQTDIRRLEGVDVDLKVAMSSLAEQTKSLSRLVAIALQQNKIDQQ